MKKLSHKKSVELATEMFKDLSNGEHKHTFKEVQGEVVDEFVRMLNEDGGRNKYTFHVHINYKSAWGRTYDVTITLESSVIYLF